LNDNYDYLYTATDREKTCVHEAAHAVIYAIGGAYITELAVRPVGDEPWQHTNSRGRARTGINGICCGNFDHFAGRYMRWNDQKGYMVVDNKGYDKYINYAAGNFDDHQRVEFLLNELPSSRVRSCTTGGNMLSVSGAMDAGAAGGYFAKEDYFSPRTRNIYRADRKEAANP